MRILFLGAYKSAAFQASYGDKRDPAMGGQRKMALLLRALLSGGHDIRVVSSAVGWRQGWGRQVVERHQQEFPEGRVDVTHASTLQRKPWGGMLISGTAAWHAVRIASGWKPDLLFAYNCLLPEACGVFGVRAFLDVPLVLEIDDISGVRGSRWHPKPMLDRAVWGPVLDRASGFVLVNSSLKDRVPLKGRPARLLPGVIDEGLLADSHGRRRAFQQPVRKLLYAGGLSVERGAGVLLEASPHLPEGWELRVAGGGPLGGEFRALAEREPRRCHYLGLLEPERVYEELTTADVVINTPEKLNDSHGVFPFKILEYMVSGAHVISSRLPELEGMDCRWFQRWSGDAGDLGELLRTAEQDFERETAVREQATTWVEQNFSVRATGRMLSTLFQECVGV